MPVDAMIRLSKALSKYIEWVGKFGSFFILPLVFITMWDVLVRKLGGMQYWLIQNLGSVFESTKIQEWEWHFHTVLFTLVLGYGYIFNRHVRVDLIREKLSFRNQAWIEFMGCTIFLIPYTLIVGWFAAEIAYGAFLVGEGSASLVGLCCRWSIRSVLVIGLFFAFLSGVVVWLQTVLVLFVPGAGNLDSPLNRTSIEHFSPANLLTDSGGATGTAGTSHVRLANTPVMLDKISVSDSSGSIPFHWVEFEPVIYFDTAPTATITVTYDHRPQLSTLVWPEVAARFGARTRSI